MVHSRHVDNESRMTLAGFLPRLNCFADRLTLLPNINLGRNDSDNFFRETLGVGPLDS
jgi:hypothetical protein